MPKLHLKQKVLGGRAEVLAYDRDPQTFYYRQYQPQTRSYRSDVIKGAKTLAEAIELAPEYMLAFSQAALSGGSVTPQAALGNRRAGHNQTLPKAHREAIDKALRNFLRQEEIRLQGGLIKPSSLKRWEKTVRVGILPYLQYKQIRFTSQISETTFDEYAAFRSGTVKTRITLRGELDVIGHFVRSYLVKHKLIAPELAVSKELIKRPKLRDKDLLANPAFTESDFQLFLKNIRQWIPEFDRQKPKSYYFRKLFYEWVLVAKNTGARPEELIKLRWRDIEHQDVRRHSETAKQENILYLKEQGIEYENLTELEQESLGDVENWITLVTLHSAKTGSMRTVPCNLSKVFDRWRDFQMDWCRAHCPGLEITPNSLVWGNPEKLLAESFSDSHFSRTWREVRDPIQKNFKGHWLSDQPYTRYSLRSTFIEVQLMKGISPVLVAEMAGHDIKVLYEIYQKLNVRQMAKEITNIDRSRKRGTERMTRSALEAI